MRFVTLAAVLAAAVPLTACMTAGPALGTDNSAELSFAKQPSPGGMPGYFSALDGKELPNSDTSIRMPAGKHTISYSCPDTITLDTHPTVRATFAAGRSYVLTCEANQPGSVTER